MRFPGTRRAVTLIEAVLFIAVALSLIVGGLVFYKQARTASQTQEFVRVISALVAEARTMDRTGGHFDSSANIGEILFKAGAVPSAYWDEGRGILDLNFGRAGQNLLREGFFLDSGNSWDERPEQARGFTFITQGLAREICNRVVPFDYESGGGRNGKRCGLCFFFNK